MHDVVTKMRGRERPSKETKEREKEKQLKKMKEKVDIIILFKFTFYCNQMTRKHFISDLKHSVSHVLNSIGELTGRTKNKSRLKTQASK